MSTSMPDYEFLWNSLNPTGEHKGSLTFPYYYAQVVGTSVDPNRAGCVQARVNGVTDLWEDKLQPWFAPQLTTGMQQVPQKGQWLMVRFIDGDINQGLYYGVSQTKSFLPANYVSEYPDVAVMNLGEAEYLYTHNRRTHVSSIKNPGNNTDITWTDAGELVVSSGNAAKEAGDASLSVLTEATIDVFTCMPVGSPDTGVRAGSEYLKVPHISQATVDALRGGGEGIETVVKNMQDSEVDGSEKRDLNGTEKTYSVPYIESSATKHRTGKKNKRILIGATCGNLLAAYLGMVTSPSGDIAVHYLVGVADGDPDVLSNLENKKDAKNRGFIQCVEITDDGTYGSDMKGKMNLNAVSVVFYGDGTLNSYQQKKLTDIINHVKKADSLCEIEVVAYQPKNKVDKRYNAYTNLKKYEGMY